MRRQRRKSFYRSGKQRQGTFALGIGVLLVLLVLLALLNVSKMLGTDSAFGSTSEKAEFSKTSVQGDEQSANKGDAASTQPDDTKVDPHEGNVLLVNAWNRISKDYIPNLESIDQEHKVDARCVADLKQLLEDCRKQGFDPCICSAYRSYTMQADIYRMNGGSLEDALSSEQTERDSTPKAVALPGASEHQTGLAVDIVDKNYQLLNSDQASRPVQQWLMKQSWRYGFVLRYPSDKTHITGIIYEPWHYRYVGKQIAEKMYMSGLCLEEYVQNYTLSSKAT